MKPVHEYIENKAEEETSETEATPDANIPKKLSQLKLYWTVVTEKLTKRESVISGLLHAAQRQCSAKEKFIAHKNAVEKKMHAVQPVPAEENEVRKQHDTLQVSAGVKRF